MMNWKYFLAATVMTSTLFAQFTTNKVQGRIILKDKDGAEMELKKDESKWTVEILDNSTDKLVLKGQSKIRFKSEKQEVILDAIQTLTQSTKTDTTENKGTSRIEFFADKATNKQDLYVRCYLKQDIRGKSELKLEKGTTECIKTSGCKAHVLGENKKFILKETSGVCIGKQEVEISAATAIDETIACAIYNETDDSDKNAAIITFTRPLENLKEREVRKTAASICK